MASIRKRTSSASAPAGLSTAGNTTAVETVSKGSRAVRTHVHYAPLFVLAQDYDDAMRALRAALSSAEFSGLSHEDAMTLTLFTSVASVLNDMVQRSDLIARASRAPDGVVDSMSVESLEARQATERALVNEGRAAIEADIAVLRARLAETTFEYKAQTARQLLDVAPYPQPGSAAAELSVLLSSNRARHRA
jgi:hypothetical protein